MKKSVSLSLFQGRKSAPILFSSDIETNIPLIAELGYDGVDLFVLDPSAEISKKYEESSAAIDRSVQQLRRDKINRSTFSELLMEMAVKMSDEISEHQQSWGDGEGPSKGPGSAGGR